MVTFFITFTNVFFIFRIKNAFFNVFFIFFLTFITTMRQTMSSRVKHGATLCTNTHGQLNIVSSFGWRCLFVCSVYMQGHMRYIVLLKLLMDSYIISAVTIIPGTGMFAFIEDTTHLSYLLRNSEPRLIPL